MMTREEAIKYAKSKKMMLESLIYNDDCKYGNYAMYSTELSFVNAVISALRPVSREQVEKVWRGEWEHKKSPYDYKIFVCTRCKKQISIQGGPLIFCPSCGAPMTDKAMQMVMERLEALENEEV